MTNERQTVKIKQLDFELLFPASVIRQRVVELGKQIEEDYRNNPPIFIGVLNGAFIFAADLMRAVDLPTSITFVKFSSYAGMQSTGEVKSLLGLEPAQVKNRPVIIVEDIVDTGKTLSTFIENLEKLHPASIRVAALLLKPDALQYNLKVDYLGFEIPPAFVIGYGLDYDEEARQLPGIYQKI